LRKSLQRCALQTLVLSGCDKPNRECPELIAGKCFEEQGVMEEFPERDAQSSVNI
jgi:hypothetical protein